jgi:Flp pilus assembly pilin Flp
MAKKTDNRDTADTDRQRGATFVEYALIVALVASVASVGVRGVTAVASAMFDNVKHSIEVGQGGVEVSDAPTTTTTTTTTIPPTTTTLPPTTTTTTKPATTTTTAPTTTTTTAPAGPTKTGATFGTSSTSVNYNGWYLATSVTVKGNNGAVLANATVTITLHYPVNWFGSTSFTDTTVTVTTDAQGRATINAGPFGRTTYWGNTTQVQLTISGITSGSVPWDGTAASQTILAP